MFRIVILFATAALCQADLPVTPPPIRCGYIPTKIYSCLGNPKLFKSDISAQCTKSTSECDRMKCIFKKSGWTDDANNVDRAKVIAHFDQFAKDHPAWAPAVNHVKASCLAGNLPPQGYELNCPPYDIVHCALSGFFKNAQPSQWSSSEECSYPRQFAAACPVCPESCFAAAIPYGSCNACRLLPQTP
uniref:Odorant-binding protein OBP38 n=1 Tax=Lobesia botrana TaxID=209534 RepID=A0A345BER1_9NEOP|nr:odorant-binding protein OBP38 [Lobesia botrana]